MTQDIAEAREQLETLRAGEGRLRDLRAREGELEVDCIATEAALAPLQTAGRPRLAPQAAAEIADALERRDELQEQVRAIEQRLTRSADTGTGQRERLQRAVAALAAWLQAPSARPSRSRAAIRAVLLATTLAIVWAAWAVHVAFLVLLFPLVGATSFLLWSNQDAKWRQLGAKQQFEATGLDPPAAWDDSTVRARSRSLADELDAASQAPCVAPDREGDVLAELDSASSLLAEHGGHLYRALAGAGLTTEALDDDLAQWVRLAAGAHRAQKDLNRVRAEYKSARGEAETVREDLFRFLARHGEAPGGGGAETSDLEAGLERLAARPSEPD